jgi:uncharacterized membrane-anchored protein
MIHRMPVAAVCAACVLLAASAQVRAQEAAAPAAAAESAATAETGSGEAAEGAAEESQLTPEQQHYMDVVRSLRWVEGPAEVKVGSKSKMKVPEGYAFLDSADTKKFQELNENIATGNEYLLAPMDLHWFALFEYEDTGYVKDDEEIDADAILTSLREGTEAANEERRKRGWAEMHVTGWRVKPAYNPESKRLEWAIDAQSEGVPTTNLFTKFLGRHGVTSVALVTSPETLTADASEFRRAVEGFEYVEGERYAEFEEGDKVAEYGLAGLIAGGTVAVAAKSGLLKSLWKVLLLGGAAALVGVRKLFGRKDA